MTKTRSISAKFHVKITVFILLMIIEQFSFENCNFVSLLRPEFFRPFSMLLNE